MTQGDGFAVRSLALTYRDGHLLAPHAHPWAQFVYALSGVMHVAADAQIWLTPPTRGVWIPAGAAHEIRVHGETSLRTLYLGPELAQRVARRVESVVVVPLLRELILHIVALEMLRTETPAHAHLIEVLMDLLAEAPGTDLSLPLPRDPRALELAHRLRAAPDDKSSLDACAAKTGASLRTLQRCFSEETGMTIESWRQKARLVHGAALLVSGASVTGAALGCGYDSPSAFSAAFRRQFGVTPGRFRR